MLVAKLIDSVGAGSKAIDTGVEGGAAGFCIARLLLPQHAARMEAAIAHSNAAMLRQTVGLAVRVITALCLAGE